MEKERLGSWRKNRVMFIKAQNHAVYNRVVHVYVHVTINSGHILLFVL